MSTWPDSLPERAEMVRFAHELADVARATVMPHFRRPVGVSYKADASPVTEVDRAVERVLRERIRARYPRHGVIGEELGADPRRDEPCWVIDPIDGTKAFVTGRPLFGTLVGLLIAGEPVLGVLEAPALGERWIGASGGPSQVNAVRCETGKTIELGHATLSATSIDMFAAGERARFDELGRRVRFRTFGGDCYAYGLLASGFLDLVVEASMQPYDYLPLVPIVTGAGGVITDWAGRALTLESGYARVLAAANPDLHRRARAVLEGAEAA